MIFFPYKKTHLWSFIIIIENKLIQSKVCFNYCKKKKNSVNLSTQEKRRIFKDNFSTLSFFFFFPFF